MRGPTIPVVFRELADEPGSFRILVVAAVALFAAGLDPKVWSPGLMSVQDAIAARPSLEILLLLGSVLGAALLFVGGILGDADGRRRILVGALAVLVVTGFAGLFVSDGPLFLADRLAGTAAANAVLPFAFALVATRYRGIPRATAIGLVYAAYGAATAVSPVLVTLLGTAGPRWPAFLAAGMAAVIALAVAARFAPSLPVNDPSERPYVIGTAVWAMAVVLVTMGLLGFGGGLLDPIRFVFIGAGGLLAAAYVAWDRHARRTGPRIPHVDRRPVTVAVAVGVVIAFAQVAPMFELPLYFQLVLRYGPVLSTLATAPFIVALVAAGPVAGILLARFQPRTLVAGGVGAVGLGNLVVALVLSPAAPYPFLVVPFILIGAGFVVATTVRTAIIFASVSRGLPATAAALNEASVQVGSRIGLVVVSILVARLALDGYAATLPAMDPAHLEAALAPFRDIMSAVGTPEMGQLATAAGPEDMALYAGAYTDAIRTALLFTGVIAVLAAPLAWAALGRRDPLGTVWEHRDERAAPAGGTPAAGATDAGGPDAGGDG
jgi:DHA2 family methylenomycin A resistance protein-like MFS transporter